MRLWKYALPALVAGAAAVPAQAQEGPPDYFKVYTYDQPLAGWAEFNLWNTVVASSDQKYEAFDEGGGRAGLVAHAAEVEYGVTDRLALGGYLDFETSPRGPFRFTQGRIVARYKFSYRHEQFINPSIYVEYTIPRAGKGDQEVEVRFIGDKDLGDFRIAANPILTMTTTGDNAGATPTAGFDAGIYYRRYRAFQPGLEYYGNFGKIGDWKNQTHYLLAAANIPVGRQGTLNIGAGPGLNGNTDGFIVKTILSFDVNAIRPSKLFGHRGPG